MRNFDIGGYANWDLGGGRRYDGGMGSGNWGHEGVHGHRGGSAPGGGNKYRYVNKEGTGYTSYAKVKKKLATTHNVTKEEMETAPVGTVIVPESHDGTKYIYTKVKDGVWHEKFVADDGTVQEEDLPYFESVMNGYPGKVALPDNLKKAALSKYHDISTEEAESLPVGSEINLDDVGKILKLSENKYKFDDDHGYTETGNSYDNLMWKIGLNNIGFSGTVKTPEGADVDNVAVAEDYKNSIIIHLGGSHGSLKKPVEGYGSEYQKVEGKVMSGKESLSAMGPESQKSWAKMTDLEKEAAYEYTMGSSYINEPLHKKTYLGNKHTGSESDKHIDALTSACDKGTIPVDMKMYHGVGTHGFSELMGISESQFIKDPKSVIDQSGTDTGFVSCGTSNGTGFTHKQVQMVINVPKGSKGLYVEPISYYGANKGTHWDSARRRYDGKEMPSHVSGENETILQRGSRFHITDVQVSNGKYFVYCDLISQKPEGFISSSSANKYKSQYEAYMKAHPYSKMSYENFANVYGSMK